MSFSLQPPLPGPTSPFCTTFQRLSASTWATLANAHKYGLRFSEESITDHILLELLQSHPGTIKVQQFNRVQEAKTGADWAWWFEGSGWLGMRVQAKRLEANTRRYEHLAHLSGKTKTRQIDLLLSAAKKDGLYPLYCFYNFWDTTVFPVAQAPLNCGSFGPSELLFGCTLAAADEVKHLIGSGKDDLTAVLGVSFPWVCLVCCPGTDRAPDIAGRVHAALQLRTRTNAPSDGRRRRRRRRPELVERPPRYVTDALEGRAPEQPPAGLRGVVVFRDRPRE